MEGELPPEDLGGKVRVAELDASNSDDAKLRVPGLTSIGDGGAPAEPVVELQRVDPLVPLAVRRPRRRPTTCRG
eukprot:SAG11_NODE_1249_length_5393_cov_4.349641_5_plen_74_part_00